DHAIALLADSLLDEVRQLVENRGDLLARQPGRLRQGIEHLRLRWRFGGFIRHGTPSLTDVCWTHPMPTHSGKVGSEEALVNRIFRRKTSIFAQSFQKTLIFIAPAHFALADSVSWWHVARKCKRFPKEPAKGNRTACQARRGESE